MRMAGLIDGVSEVCRTDAKEVAPEQIGRGNDRQPEEDRNVANAELAVAGQLHPEMEGQVVQRRVKVAVDEGGKYLSNPRAGEDDTQGFV